ncbi:FG-GAP-like repeat-containing protein [Phormidesmis priestleyi]|uniref:FG-GAP-like repeat-containing protein n=1 Tax=Phormidesmis priestleyi TaxID=268141 RepID=UPI00083ABA52|nr:FG-GAP-like repeat-containing protein [Phormidesmis priestleyi]
MAYDTLETAKDVSLSSSAQTFTNSISRVDSTDYYRFQFKSYSSLSAVLNHLNGDVNLELIQDRDRNGVVSSSEVLSASNNSGAIDELINTTLAPGTYYLRVSTSQDSDRYSLDLSATSDLKTDLVWRNYATGENASWQMKDNAIASAVFLTKVTDPNWKLETTADFNHDGQPDLFWRNYTTGENAVWQMKGNAIDSVVYFTKVTDPNWKLAGVADFNNDGQADLIWRNYATGENAVWQMNGNAIQSAVYLTKVPDLNWKLAGVADFNNDGQADLIWRNYATGENAVWQMKGNAIDSAVWLLKIPDPNWQLVSISKQFDQSLTNDAVGNTIANATAITNPVVNYGAASGSPSIDALWNANHAYWNTSANGGVIPYSFYTNGSGAYTGNETVSEVSSLIKNNVRSILSSIESYINVRFVEVADTATSCGVIRYLYSDGRSSANSAAYSFYAYGYYPGDGIGSDVHLNPNQAASFEEGAGSYGYTALLHETLHTLGLKHSGNYNVGGGTTEGPYLSPGDDNLTNTVMTYNNGTSDTKYTGSKSVTLMPYDIRALQYLYGARDNNANSTTYTFKTVYGYAVGNQFFGSTTTELKQSIWDAGGVDTLDFSGLSTASNYRFDLNPGGILTTQSSYNGSTYYDYSQDSQPTDGIPQGPQYATSNFGTTIAYGTVIENLINSPGNDDIIANAASNIFKGYTFGTFTGNDVIESGSAADVVELAGYTLSNLTTAVSGSNLTIGLGSSGSIQLQNYYGANGSLKFLVGGAYYTYSSGGWQAAAPVAIAPPNASDAIVTGGLTSTVASTSRM